MLLFVWLQLQLSALETLAARQCSIFNLQNAVVRTSETEIYTRINFA